MNVKLYILAATNVNDFVIHLKRLPLRIQILVVTLTVQFLHVQVLHIGVERGKAPCHVLIMPRNHKRQARQSDSGGVIARRAQIGHEPDIRFRETKMHIVREQRLAADCVFA